MPSIKLTKSAIDRVAKPGGAETFFWDTETKGLGIRVSPTGAATFIAQARVAGTKIDRRITVGAFGIFTLDQAREIAREHLRTMKMGIDPTKLKKQREAEQMTLRQVMEGYVSRPGALKPKTADEYRRNVEKTLAAWADLPISSISREMVLERHSEIADHGLEDKKRSPGKGAPSSANSAMTTLRILLTYAMDTFRLADGKPIIAENPVKVMKRHWRKDGDRSKRNIPDDKIGKVWNALHDMRATAMNGDALTAIDLVLMALLTGARKNELAALEWSRINIDDEKPENCWLHLPDPKNGSEVFLPLSQQAVVILKQRPKVKDKDGNDSPFIFASRSKLGYITEARAPLETVTTIAGKHLSLHDMRRTMTGIALRVCRIEKFRVDLLTNHQPPKSDTTTRAYFDTSNLQWLHGEAQKIGAWIEQQGVIAAGDNVVQLPARA